MIHLLDAEHPDLGGAHAKHHLGKIRIERPEDILSVRLMLLTLLPKSTAPTGGAGKNLNMISIDILLKFIKQVFSKHHLGSYTY